MTRQGFSLALTDQRAVGRNWTVAASSVSATWPHALRVNSVVLGDPTLSSLSAYLPERPVADGSALPQGRGRYHCRCVVAAPNEQSECLNCGLPMLRVWVPPVGPPNYTLDDLLALHNCGTVGELNAYIGRLEGRAMESEDANPLDVLAVARLAARRHHYALTIHGSMARDLDLVLIPWKEKASQASVVIEAIREAVGGMIFVDDPDGREGYYTIDDEGKRSPVERPHGRWAWSIYGVLGGSYLDISVMPLRGTAEPGDRAPSEPWEVYSPSRDNEEVKTWCRSGRDGECNWSECPQLRDNEPARSLRHCPLDLVALRRAGGPPATPPNEEPPK